MTGTDRAARVIPRIAFVTCASLPDLDPDDRLAISELRRHGCAVVPAVWDDPAVDWAAFDLAVLRTPWDYPPRREEFVTWALGVPQLVNPAPVVAWNTDKHYLEDLASAGVPIVPTTFVGTQARWDPPRSGEWVVKPAVGAGGRYAGRFRLDDPEHRRLAGEHVERVLSLGRQVMVQPYLAAVDRVGETGLVFLADGDGLLFSHAIRKGPMLTAPVHGTEALSEQISAREAAPAELAVARRALDAIPGGPGNLLYARVDLISGPDGEPLLIELELAEPSLFLGYHPGAPEAFADAIAARVASIRNESSAICRDPA
jgi:hypothetical protein